VTAPLAGDLETRAIALVSQFLDSLYERQDLTAHLACYHPDAWVVVGPRLVPRRDLTAESYADAIGALALEAVRPPGVRPPRFEVAGSGHLQLADPEAVWTVSMTDRTEGRPFLAAFWLRTDGPGWLLLGCTVLPTPEPLPASRIPALVAAELGQVALVPEPGELLLTPLDLAYRRAFPIGDWVLESLPETRFTCEDSGHCCGSHWGIRVPAAARQAWGSLEPRAIAPALPTPLFTLHLAANGEAQDRLAGHGDHCAFHQGDRCTIHTAAGYQPLPVCAAFPIGLTATPEGIALWTSFTCPTARANRGALLTERYDDMVRRLRLNRGSMASVPETVTTGTSAPDWVYSRYRVLEEALLGLLADRSRSPRERVRGAIAEARRQLDLPVDRAATGRTWDGYDGRDLATFLVLSNCLPEALQGPLAVLGDDDKLRLSERLEAAAIDFVGDDELMTRYLRQVLYRKKYLSELGVVGHVAMVGWVEACVRVGAIALAVAEGRATAEPDDVARAVVAVEKAAYHTRIWADKVVSDPELSGLLRQGL
jgi:hypothetical protein